jgi:hypothetical protein
MVDLLSIRPTQVDRADGVQADPLDPALDQNLRFWSAAA